MMSFLKASNNKVTTGVDVELCVGIQILLGDGCVHHLLHDVLPQGLQGDLLTMLAWDNNGVHSDGYTGTLVKYIFCSNLSLGVRSCPPQGSVSPQVRDLLVHLVSKHEGQGHALLCLIGGITEHKSLHDISCITLLIKVTIFPYSNPKIKIAP